MGFFVVFPNPGKGLRPLHSQFCQSRNTSNQGWELYPLHPIKNMTLITSPSNPRISKLRELHTTRGRKKSGLFLMEGPHLLAELLDAQIMPHEVYYQSELLQRTADGRSLLKRLLYASSLTPQQLIEVSERVIESLGETHTSQGIVGVLALNAFQPELVRARRTTTSRPALLVL